MIAPKVSVIIPNYNHAMYLRQRIDSVLHQTYRNLEVFILDDASTDNSREVISEYAGHPLVKTIVYNERNSGSPFRQWERGVALATGEWVWIAESDDYANEKFLEIMLSPERDLRNAGLIYCDSNVVSNNTVLGNTFAALKNEKFKTSRWSNDYLNSGTNEIECYLLPEGTINNTSAVLFKRELLTKVDIFDLDMRYIGDKYAFIKVLSKSDVVYVKESLNYYRDPFNNKHADKFIFYFQEQFLIFDWVYKNVPVSRQNFFDAFYKNTRNSVYRSWSKVKLRIYLDLFRVNKLLFLKCLINNIRAPFSGNMY